MDIINPYEGYLKTAKTLIGTWIQPKDNEEEVRYVYSYSCFIHESDVLLNCLALPTGAALGETYNITDDEGVWMSEFDEYFQSVPAYVGENAWAEFEKAIDKIIGGGK